MRVLCIFQMLLSLCGLRLIGTELCVRAMQLAMIAQAQHAQHANDIYRKLLNMNGLPRQADSICRVRQPESVILLD